MPDAASNRRGLAPVLAPMLESRKTAAVLALIAAVQLGTALLGWPGWPCPFLHATGLPCPGCGLSRACAELLRGHWRAAIRLHAFSPLLLAGIFLLALAAALPPALIQPAARLIRRLESASGATGIILVLLVFYWLARLWYAPLSLPR